MLITGNIESYILLRGRIFQENELNLPEKDTEEEDSFMQWVLFGKSDGWMIGLILLGPYVHLGEDPIISNWSFEEAISHHDLITEPPAEFNNIQLIEAFYSPALGAWLKEQLQPFIPGISDEDVATRWIQWCEC